MKYDVFISYSSLDQKVAEGVCAYLEQHRIRCFIAYRDIPKGVVWASAIVEALDESRMMVVVFSGNFNSSKQVDREIELASEDEKPILTFRISDDAFKGAKKYYLKNLNWIDAFPQPEQCFGNLCENVRKLLGMEELEIVEKGRLWQVERKQVSKEQKMALGRIMRMLIDNVGDNKVCRFRKAAERGRADAQLFLGVCYEKGDGVSKDMEKAVYWYRRAAEQGLAEAQCNLGLCCQKGDGVSKDFQQAVYWYRKAAEQGYAEAQCRLGFCYDSGNGIGKDDSLAIYWYRKAAEQKYVLAYLNLGFCYFYKDMFQAVYWWRKAAEQGDADAQFLLAGCCEQGEGIEKNFSQAVYWYRKAAQQGNANAQKKLKELGETW